MLLSEYSQHKWAKEAETVLEKMKTVQEILDPVTSSQKVSSIDRNWKLKTKKFPYSCTDEEGLMLYFTIVENDFKSGFEIATAFGYSTSFLGLAFQKKVESAFRLIVILKNSRKISYTMKVNFSLLLRKFVWKLNQGNYLLGWTWQRT
jgi:predicted O-methyltransferase YrrM